MMKYRIQPEHITEKKDGKRKPQDRQRGDQKRCFQSAAAEDQDRLEETAQRDLPCRIVLMDHKKGITGKGLTEKTVSVTENVKKAD